MSNGIHVNFSEQDIQEASLWYDLPFYKKWVGAKPEIFRKLKMAVIGHANLITKKSSGVDLHKKPRINEENEILRQNKLDSYRM